MIERVEQARSRISERTTSVLADKRTRVEVEVVSDKQRLIETYYVGLHALKTLDVVFVAQPGPYS